MFFLVGEVGLKVDIWMYYFQEGTCKIGVFLNHFHPDVLAKNIDISYLGLVEVLVDSPEISRWNERKWHELKLNEMELD